MSVYADTSFFVSLYMFDRHSTSAQRLISSKPELWLTPLHTAEWTNAIEQHVFRNVLSANDAVRLHDEFRHDAENGSWIQAPMPDLTYARCIDLARRYTAKFGTRTLDTMHVASALELGAKIFWTFDERQQNLARASGLKLA